MAERTVRVRCPNRNHGMLPEAWFVTCGLCLGPLRNDPPTILAVLADPAVEALIVAEVRAAAMREMEAREAGRLAGFGEATADRIYWHPEWPEDGQSDLAEATEHFSEDETPPYVARIERAARLPDGWIAVRTDPADGDRLLVTEHDTEAEAHAALLPAPTTPTEEGRDADVS